LNESEEMNSLSTAPPSPTSRSASAGSAQGEAPLPESPPDSSSAEPADAPSPAGTSGQPPSKILQTGVHSGGMNTAMVRALPQARPQTNAGTRPAMKAAAGAVGSPEGLKPALAYFKAAFSKLFEAAPARSQADRLKGLAMALKFGKGNPAEVLDRARHFALHNKRIASELLSHERVAESLGKALKGNKSLAPDICDALRQEISSQYDVEMSKPYADKIEKALALGSTAKRIEGLLALRKECVSDDRLSRTAKDRIEQQIDEAMIATPWDAQQFQNELADLTRDFTIDDYVAGVVDQRLKQLGRLQVMLVLRKASGELSPEDLRKLDAEAGRAGAFLTTLDRRGQNLEALGDSRNLRSVLGGLSSAKAYVQAQQGLDDLLKCVDPGAKSKVSQSLVLKRLDEMITDSRQAEWLGAMHEGDNAIIDMMLPHADLDDDALRMKLAGLARRQAAQKTDEPEAVKQARHEREKLAVEAQHAWRVAARSLDAALAATSEKLPQNAFRAAKADARLISAIVKKAPVGADLDLLIANVVTLSLYDPRLSKEKQDEVYAAALKALPSLKGVSPDRIKNFVAQGFRNHQQVLNCRKAIDYFAWSLAKNAERLQKEREQDNPLVHAERVGCDLLREMGIKEFDGLSDPGIDGQLKDLLAKQPWMDSPSGPTPEQRERAKKLLTTVKHIAILRAAVMSEDDGFTTKEHAAMVMSQLDSWGVHLQRNGYVQAFVNEARNKLVDESRGLHYLLKKYDPQTPWNKLKAMSSSSKRTADSKADKQDQALGSLKADLGDRVKALEKGGYFGLSFGRRGEVEISTPVAPGLSAAGNVQVERSNALKVSFDGERCQVEISRELGLLVGGTAGLHGGLLKFHAEADASAAKGYRYEFTDKAKCALFLDALVERHRLTEALDDAAGVQISDRLSLRGGASATATLDLMLAAANASATLEGSASRQRYTKEGGVIEIFERQVKAGVAGKLEAAGGLAGRESEISVDAACQEAVSRKEGLYDGADRVYSLAAAMTSKRFMTTVLRGLPQEEHAKLLEKTADSEGDESMWFVHFTITDDALRTARHHQGLAKEARRQRKLGKAVSHEGEAERFIRASQSYRLVGYGRTSKSTGEVEENLVAYKNVAGSRSGGVEYFPMDPDSPATLTPLALNMLQA
jgi:hypothetical protein